MKINLNTISYTTAISLAVFSGGVATFGMMKLVPGAEIVVGAMGLLFEAGKLTSFAMLHRRSVPRLLRGALATVGLTLMAANVAGVSGFLSHEYEKTHINAQATGHTAESTAHAEASLLERQLSQAEAAVAQARTALIRAKDDRGRVKAAQAVLTTTTADRDALVARPCRLPTLPPPRWRGTRSPPPQSSPPSSSSPGRPAPAPTPSPMQRS
jgi:hypothetical protein